MYSQMVFIHGNWLKELSPILPSMENSPSAETIMLLKDSEIPSDSAKAIICVNTTAQPNKNMKVFNISKMKCKLENILSVIEVTLWSIKTGLLGSLSFVIFPFVLSGISSLIFRNMLLDLCSSDSGFISSIAATHMWSNNPLLIIQAPAKNIRVFPKWFHWIRRIQWQK